MHSITKRSKGLHINEENIYDEIKAEVQRGENKFGTLNSQHEAEGVIREEFEEWWDSVKANDPDPYELIQLAAVAKRAAMQLIKLAQDEMEACSHCTFGIGGLHYLSEKRLEACMPCLGMKE